MSAKNPLRLFYSYSHRDEGLRNRLETHLAILKREGRIEGWHDRRISAGVGWEDTISEHLEAAHIILLLISADFIASDYCYEIEMKRALERHAAGQARVIPIILRDAAWHGAPFGRLQALPTNAKPITSWKNRDEAWTDVAKGIRKVVDELTGHHVDDPPAHPRHAGVAIAPAVPPTTPRRLPPWLDEIKGNTLPQLILSDAPLIRVIAGPGSGKTTGLKRRVVRLPQRDSVSPSRIFVGTFTRAIAEALRDALGVDVDYHELPSDTDTVQVSTLHSLAYRLLQQYPLACPNRRFRFLLEFEEETMLYDIGQTLTDSGKQRMREERLKQILAGWADGRDLTNDQFAGEMERWLQWHGGMLIGEVVKLAQRALEKGKSPEVCLTMSSSTSIRT